MIPSWLSPVATLVNKLIDIIERIIRAYKEKQRQARADHAAEDPGRAFAEHGRGELRDLPKPEKTDNTEV